MTKVQKELQIKWEMSVDAAAAALLISMNVDDIELSTPFYYS